MFERFTDRARRVVMVAQDTARKHGHSAIEPLHLAVGLVAEHEGVAAVVLLNLQYTATGMEQKLLEKIPDAGEPAPGHIPFSEAARKVLEVSLREALQLGHNWIGTEHILLALIREDEGVFTDTEGSEIRRDVIHKLASYKSYQSPVVSPETESDKSRRAVAIITNTWDALSRLHRLQILTELLDANDPEDRAWIRRFLDTEYDRNGDAS